MAQYTIRELSSMFDLPASTLRYYEDMGILTDVERTPSGQRIYGQEHINRLRTICCFKHTGMSMAQLKQFFSYETDEPAHIDDVLNLLNDHREQVLHQMEEMQKAYAHVLRKLHYYGDIKKSIDEDKPLPSWDDYRDMLYTE